MKKLFPILVLLLMLVILPLGSYLYLRSGVDYRLAALDMVTPKGELLDFTYYKNGLKLNSSRALNHKTSIIHIDQSNDNDRYIQGIFDQFNQSENLELLQLKEDSVSNHLEGFDIVYTPEFRDIESNYKDYDILLVDTSLQIRSYYDLNDSTINELIRDIAIVLPLKKKSTIKMKDR